MAIGTTDFVDAAAWTPPRSATRDVATAAAATARARFARDLNAANRAADATKAAARSRDAAERARSDDAAALARADRAKASEKKPTEEQAPETTAAETKPVGAPVSGSKASATAEPIQRSAVAVDPKPPASRPDDAGSTRDSGPARPADAKASADGASDVPADADALAAKTAADDAAKPGDGQTDEAKAEDASIPDAKGSDAAPATPTLATPTLAIVLGATVPAARSGGAAVPAAAAGGQNAVSVDAATTKTGTGPAAIAGRPASVGDTTGEDKATGTDQAGAPATKADFLAALTDAGPTAPATPEAAAKAVLAASAAAPSVAEKAATAAAAPPVPLGQVPMTIGLRSLAGSSEFQIRLDPLELGRIDVKLDIDKARGTVTTHLVVERVETLAMLQRDAGSLQQALAQAGLDPSEGGINLSLRSDGGTGGETARRDAQPGRGTALPGTLSEAAATEAAPLRALRGLSGLDIRI